MPNYIKQLFMNSTMKATISTILFALATTLCSAQTVPYDFANTLDTLGQSKMTAVYSYTINTLDADGNMVVDSILMAVEVGDGMWKSTPYGRMLTLLGKMDEDNHDKYGHMEMEAMMHVATLIVGYPEGKITSHEAVAPYCYEVAEDRERIDWTLTADTDSTCGYECKGARGEFCGKKWEVLYAEDIATPAGPWKLGGLPGLITYATDAEHTHTFTLVGLLNEVHPLVHEKFYNRANIIPSQRKITAEMAEYEKKTLSELLSHKRKTFGNRAYPSKPLFYNPEYWKVTNGQRITIEVGGNDFDTVNGVVILNKAHVYQPLEMNL